MTKYAKYLGLFIVFAWFMGGGIAHFLTPDFFVNIMPPYIPWHLEIVYFTGVIEIIAALAILWPATRQIAGTSLFVFTIAVTPANVHMWLNPELYPEVAPAMLSIRLVIQVILLAIIWFSTRDAKPIHNEIPQSA